LSKAAGANDARTTDVDRERKKRKARRWGPAMVVGVLAAVA
jgi:hypothetical protein